MVVRILISEKTRDTGVCTGCTEDPPNGRWPDWEASMESAAHRKGGHTDRGSYRGRGVRPFFRGENFYLHQEQSLGHNTRHANQSKLGFSDPGLRTNLRLPPLPPELNHQRYAE